MTKKIYFAGGCFWGTEHLFKQVKGVENTEVGYADSDVANPTYQQVCSGQTGAAETVEVDYNPAIVSPQHLIDLFLESIDATTVNRQGNDIGTQYRSAIYYTEPMQKAAAEMALDRLSKRLDKKLAVELKPLTNFYRAEDYHQDYLTKNPRGYCHVSPALFQVARNSKDPYINKSAQSQLTPMQYAVTKENATEPPFHNEYWDEHRPGIYVDISTGEPLFVSSDKFDSGCGWPSFSKPITEDAIKSLRDTSHGMERVEVRTTGSDSHLGHVFPDGPKDRGGMRYCINSAALRFVPLDKMAQEGYKDLIPLVKASENN